MKRICIGLAIALASLVGIQSSHAAGVPTAQDVKDSADAASSVESTSSDETPLADAGAAAHCTPKTGVTKTASVTSRNDAGVKEWVWHHSITYSYDCTNVTDLTHSSWLTVYLPAYTSHGYLANTVSGVGTPHGTAFAQARVGVCTNVGVDGCFLEHDPAIGWAVSGRGIAKVVTKSLG